MSTLSQKALENRRFDVAFSFSGKWRSRVEPIANALADKIGRDQILYDQWYRAESGQPMLGFRLPDLYLHESKLVVVFLTKDYADNEWCRLEWRAIFELIKRRQSDRLLLVRLDAVNPEDIEGLYSSDGWLDIAQMNALDVAEEIVVRLQMLVPRPPEPDVRYDLSIHRLPVVNSKLVGRKIEKDLLDRWGHNAATNVIQVIAPGGTGKTALVYSWVSSQDHRMRTFCWPFHSQGLDQPGGVPSGEFFRELKAFLRFEVPDQASAATTIQYFSAKFRNEPVLLVLDGLESMQDRKGVIWDPALRGFLRELAADNRGLVLCTSRVRLADLPDDAPRLRSLELGDLTVADGAEYLKSLDVDGTDPDLEAASHEYGNNALALTLLGTYLVEVCSEDVRRRSEIPALLDERMDGTDHAKRVMAGYARMLAESKELLILEALGLFYLPIPLDLLEKVLPDVRTFEHRAAMTRLKKLRLIFEIEPSGEVYCHALVREYFGKLAETESRDSFISQQSHLYELCSKKADTTSSENDRLLHLVHGVYHGCRSGKHAEAFRELYRRRICKDDYSYLSKGPGSFGQDLFLLSKFFDEPWEKPVKQLSPGEQLWLLTAVSHAMRAAGMLQEALHITERVAEQRREDQAWEEMALVLGQLSEIELALGHIDKAIKAGRLAVEKADQSDQNAAGLQRRGKDTFLQGTVRAILGDALHQSGATKEAGELFQAAEGFMSLGGSGFATLLSRSGYAYNDFLLREGNHDEAAAAKQATNVSGEPAETETPAAKDAQRARDRAERNLLMPQHGRWLLDVGLDYLARGRSYRKGSAKTDTERATADAKAESDFSKAIDSLWRSGQLEYLTLALLARALPHDLERARAIATRCGLRLRLADYHMSNARLKLTLGVWQDCQDELVSAEQIAKQAGYGRLLAEIDRMRHELMEHSQRKMSAGQG